MTHQRIEDLLADLDAGQAALTAAGDSRRFFHATYTRTTRAVAEEIARGGFEDNEWVHRWDLAFADFYLAALEADQAGRRCPGPGGWLSTRAWTSRTCSRCGTSCTA